MAGTGRTSRTPDGRKENRAGDNAPGVTAPRRRPWTWRLLVAAAAILAIVAVTLSIELLTEGSVTARFTAARSKPAEAATFVGSEACAGCHRSQADLWRGSQHRLAMQHANEKTMLGDFNDTRFEHYGVQSRFFRRDGKFMVETDGPDGKPAAFEIKYTFGVDPLQQYLIEFPDGRLQALSIAWDSRPKEQGGQRWFHLYPDEEIKHDDVLH